MELHNTVDTNIPSKDASGGLVPIGVCMNCLFKLLKSDISIIYYHSLCSNYEYRLFHSLHYLKNLFTLISFCMNSAVYNVRNRAVIELSFVVWINGFPCH